VCVNTDRDTYPGTGLLPVFLFAVRYGACVLGVGRVVGSVAIPAGFGAHPPLVRSPPSLRPLPLPSEIPLAVFKRLYGVPMSHPERHLRQHKSIHESPVRCMPGLTVWCVLWFGFLFVVSV
jgi:hypothetical protein